MRNLNRRFLPILASLAIVLPHRLSAFTTEVAWEEDVYRYVPADNGAGPLWCHGSTCVVTVGDIVYVSGLETLPNAKPLNNCRWTLWRRDADGWKRIQVDEQGRTREPCPLATFEDGSVFLSANPTLVSDPEQYGGPARPEILRFDGADAGSPFATLLPRWQGSPAFTEHSYRSFAADGLHRQFVLFQNVGYTHGEWTFHVEGEWRTQGQLKWPWGADYAKPQPIRVCYPNVAVKGGAVYFCGVSDIVEPNPEWRAFKKELTGREWDYDFRRLFFTWTPDITQQEFSPWVEIASREETCGWIMPGDLWVDDERNVHVLWSERAIDERLRARFFPEAKQSHALHYALIREGKVVLRRPVSLAREGESRLSPGRGRFHVTLDRRLFVVYYQGGVGDGGRAVSENRLVEVLPGGVMSPPVRIDLERPFTDFFTATTRAGSMPSNTLHLLGQRQGVERTMSYAGVRID